MVQVQVSAVCKPTEVMERVTQAVRAFWPDLEVRADGERIVGTGHDVQTFRDVVWRARIIDTVRGQLLAGLDGATCSFLLSKQAAYQGRLGLSAAAHGLGDVRVRFTVEDGDPWADAEALAWWICPETADGEIVA